MTLEWVLAVLLGASVLALALTVRQHRGSAPGRTQSAQWAARAVELESAGPWAVPQDVPSVLVPWPGSADRFLVMGDSGALPGVVDRQPLGLWSERSRSRAATKLAAALNLPAQAAHGFQQGADLVRLSGETVRALQDGAKFVEVAGKSSGVLRAANGQFAHVVRFESVSAAASTVASLGNAMTMAAIQMQLQAIESQLERMSHVLASIQEEARLERLAEIRGLTAAICDQAVQARAAGEVTDRAMSEVSGKGAVLDAHIRRLDDQLRLRLSRVPRTGQAEDWRRWLGDDGVVAVEEIQQLIVALQGWTMQRALYAANLGESDAPADLINQKVAIDQAMERRADVEAQITELVFELRKAFQVATRLPGRVKLSERAAKRVNARSYLTSETVEDLAKQLDSLLEATGIPVPRTPEFPPVSVLGTPIEPDVREWRSLLMCVLPHDEAIQLVIEGRGVGGHNNARTRASVLVLTDRRVLGLRKDVFLETGRLDVDLGRAAVTGAHVTRAQVGWMRMPGLTYDALRVEYRGGAIDLDLDSSSEDDRRAIERMVQSVLDGSSPQVAAPALTFARAPDLFRELESA